MAEEEKASKAPPTKSEVISDLKKQESDLQDKIHDIQARLERLREEDLAD